MGRENLPLVGDYRENFGAWSTRKDRYKVFRGPFNGDDDFIWVVRGLDIQRYTASRLV